MMDFEKKGMHCKELGCVYFGKLKDIDCLRDKVKLISPSSHYQARDKQR